VRSVLKNSRGIPLFISLGLLGFAAIVASGVLFTWLIRWHDTKLYTRQSIKNVQFMADSVRSRIAAPVIVRDYEQVDRIMREAFGTDISVAQAFVIDDRGEIYYDLAGHREGRVFKESMKLAGVQIFDAPIVLMGGMGFMVPEGQTAGRLVVASHVYDPITDKQLSALMQYSRALISDLGAKLDNNEVFAARAIIANMLQNSENIHYAQWMDLDGLVRAHMDEDNPEGGNTRYEGKRLADRDATARRALTVTVRKPLLIQETGMRDGAPLLDIAIPLVHEGRKAGVIRLGYSNREFAETRRQAHTAIIMIVCSFLASGLLLGFAVAYPIARPILALAHAARSAASGDLSLRAPETMGSREMRALARDFNSMIAQRAQAEAALRESEEKFRRLFETAPDIILRWSPSAGIEYVNPAIETITGYSPDEITGQSGFLMSRLHPDDQKSFADALIQSIGAKGAPRPLNLRIFHKNDFIVFLEALIFPIMNENGEVASIECIARDITERVRAEAEKNELQDQLLQMQKMEAVGQLAGGIAHDFNNMLTVIMANADLGLIYADKGTRFHQYFKDILLATERARNLTMKLLTFARKEKVNVQNILISTAVNELMDILDRSMNRNIRMQTVINADPVVRADVTQLQQALLNICTNAMDAMPDGGSLTVTCDRVTLTEQDCAPHPDSSPGAFCAISITDTGVGMAPDIVSRVCEPFFTTKGLGKGTGLGLSTTHGIMKSHGGHLTIRSKPGQGTTVTLYLPVDGGRIEEAIPGPMRPSPIGSETVLVVDDEPSVMNMTAAALAHAGYKIIKASSGGDALEIFKTRAADISLVVCDMIMPGMDGAETFRAMREIAPGVKFILCSGYSIEGKAGSLMAEGVRAFVQKPFSYDALVRTVRDVLDGKA